MSEHRWYTLPPSNTTDATRYEKCRCGAMRICLSNYAGTAKDGRTHVWVNGAHECPLPAIAAGEGK